MKKYRKALISLLCAGLCCACAVSASGCKSEQEASSSAPDEPVETNVSAGTEDEAKPVSGLQALGIDPSMLGIEPNVLHDANSIGFQLELPQEGDTIAIIHTTEGDITLRLFAEQAPKTVTNFINLAKDGRYNNTTFHRVIGDFVIQGGHCGDDPDAPNGTSSYGDEFEDEFCDKLFNIRGAVSMANSAKDTNGSQFFINQTSADVFKQNGGWSAYDDLWENVKTQLVNYKASNLLSAFIDENGDKFINTEVIPSEVKSLYVENGGNPNLDGAFNAADRGNTVFAQVIDGMDVVYKIANVETDKKNVPIDSVIIKSIEITTYSANPETTAEDTTMTEETTQAEADSSGE